jgi:hypothetical protein
MTELDRTALLILFEAANRYSTMKFIRDGVLEPMWFAETKDDDKFAFSAIWDDKDTQMELVREVFKLRDVVRYIFIDEAWAVYADLKEAPEVERLAAAGQLSTHAKRREIVVFTGEDEFGEMSAERPIIRPKDAPAYLGDMSKP